jgi:hypothetical protein
MKKIITWFLFASSVSLLTFHVSLVKADWVQVNNGLTNHNVNALCSYTSGAVNYLFAGTLEFPSSLFVSTNDGNSWQVSWQIPNNVWALAATSGGGLNYVFAGTGNGMGYTTNNGANWYSAGLPHWIYSAAASGNYVFAGCKWQTFDSGGVYRSTNLGINWTRTSLPISYAYLDYNGLIINGNYVSAGAGGSPYGGNGLYRSMDNGANWTLVTTGVAPGAFTINGSYIFAGGGTGVWVSTNNGMNWTQTSLNSGTILALLTYNNTVFAGGLGTVFWVSTNNGSTWINRNEGGVGGIRALTISNGYVFAGTDGGGVYRRPLSEIVGIKSISNEIPKNFELYQNYPNPFNAVTNISFDISSNANVNLIVYDILGRELETLVNEKLRPGRYKIDWNANNFASGVYIYRLEVNNEIINSKKLILNK